MPRGKPLIPLLACGAAAAILFSGGTRADPRTPRGLPGLATPFLGVAVVGSGGATAAIDAYGSVADLRAEPAGAALIDNPYSRQTAGSVAGDTGIVIRIAVGDRPPIPTWRADRVTQRFLAGSSALQTTVSLGGARVSIVDAAAGDLFARRISVGGAPGGTLRLDLGLGLRDSRRCRQDGADGGGERRMRWRGTGSVAASLVCDLGPGRVSRRTTAGAVVSAARRGDRRWLSAAEPLGAAPGWASRLYRRSLLVLRASLSSRGALAAGARDGWAYVWPRDAAAAALALADAGYRRRAARIAGFLCRIDLSAGARFNGDGTVVDDGRAAQGDAAGWVRAAARAASGGADPPGGCPPPAAADSSRGSGGAWRGRADYGERSDDRGVYLGNAIASAVPGSRIKALFATRRGLARSADSSGEIDSAAAWAVRPFPRPGLGGAVRRSLLAMISAGGRFGIEPSEEWPGTEAWTAPTAWSAWSAAALGEGRSARSLLAMLRRAATPTGSIPERVDPRGGVPLSTTPLAWSHAFAILALRELWSPSRN